jgi:hypothetical protein
MKYLFIYFYLGHLTYCKAWICISLELSNYFVLLLLLPDVIIIRCDFLLHFFLKKVIRLNSKFGARERFFSFKIIFPPRLTLKHFPWNSSHEFFLND